MSSSEIKDISRRFYAAKLLRQGKTYQEVNTVMGMSQGTINKINFKTKGSRIIPDLI
ncbi:MAG: Trp family transcriptional regulator [Candidatus Berkelbacteria bacterium]|nr:Trp family transcriptional regulator [Candidatus Berkelbacteria bacterium]